MTTLSVEQMTPIELHKLRHATHKLTVYHQTSSDSTDRRVLLEGVPAALLGAFSPYCKALIESSPLQKTITITGGSASSHKEIIKFMVKYCENKKALPAVVGDSQLLAYFQLHEAAEVLQVENVSGWAMAEADTILESPVTPDDVTAVLNRYQNCRYQGLVRYNLAYCMSAWLGGYSEDCKFVKDLEKDHADFVVQLRLTCVCFNAERNDALTAKSKALCAEEDRVRAEEERKAKQAEKRKAYQKERKNRRRAETLAHQVATPIRKITPSPVGSYAAVAATPVPATRSRAVTATAPIPEPDPHTVNRARTHTVAAAAGPSWASIARRGGQRAAQ